MLHDRHLMGRSKFCLHAVLTWVHTSLQCAKSWCCGVKQRARPTNHSCSVPAHGWQHQGGQRAAQKRPDDT